MRLLVDSPTLPRSRSRPIHAASGNNQYMTTRKKPTTSRKQQRAAAQPAVTDDEHMLAMFAQRLASVLDSHGYPPIMAHRCDALAGELAVSPAGVRKWLVGAGMPSSAMLKTIAEKLAVSIDWLFDVSMPASRFASDNAGKSVPVYTPTKLIDPHTFGLSRAAFQRTSILSLTNADVLLCPVDTHAFLVQSWLDLPSVGIERGDLLLGETALQGIADGQVYVVRTGKGTTFVRRAIFGLNEAVTFQTVEEPGLPHSYGPSQIVYASSFEADGLGRAITILGRLIGRCRFKY